MRKLLFAAHYPKAYGRSGPLAKGLGGFLTLLWLLSATAEAQTIAVLGDSLVAGYGLPVEEGLVAQLGAALGAQGLDATLQNAGVSGDTTAGAKDRLAWTLADGAQGMILLIGGNDMLRGLPLEVTKANLEAILTEAQVPVFLIGVPSIGNFGPEYQARFAALYADLAMRHGTAFFPDYLAPLVEGQSLAEARQLYMQPDGIHPNAQGVAKIVERLAPEVLKFIQGIDSK